jgi:hypothetical protein
MDSLTIRILAFVLGSCAVIFNKYWAGLTARWQKLVFGRDFGNWPNRIPFIVIGILAIIVSFFAT